MPDVSREVKFFAGRLLEEFGVRVDVYQEHPPECLTPQETDGETHLKRPFWIKFNPSNDCKAYQVESLEYARNYLEFALILCRKMKREDDCDGDCDGKTEPALDLRDHLAHVGAIFVRMGHEAFPSAEVTAAFEEGYQESPYGSIRIKFRIRHLRRKFMALITLPRNFTAIIDPFEAAQSIFDRIFFEHYECASGNPGKTMTYPASTLKQQHEENEKKAADKLKGLAQQIEGVSESLRRKEPVSRVYYAQGPGGSGY